MLQMTISVMDVFASSYENIVFKGTIIFIEVIILTPKRDKS